MAEATAAEQRAQTAALRMEDVSKHFGGAVALDSLSLAIDVGEVHGLIGQNGSGKSTLIKILAGYHTPSPGSRAWLWDEPLSWPIEARSRGIAVVHQDLGLVEGLSVLENFAVASRFGGGGLRPVRWASQRAELRDWLQRFDLEADPDSPIERLTPADRAIVAILRALRQLEEDGGRSLLLLDEPTAFLARDEVDRVLGLMRSVAAAGGSVIFITHRLHEIVAVCDRVSVLRDGRRVATVDAAETSEQQLITEMLGREIGDFYPEKPQTRPGRELLRVEGLRGRRVDDVGFAVHAGEIVGVTGLVGMGQDELPSLIVGAQPLEAGEILVGEVPVPSPSPRAMAQLGIVLVPADRQRDGVWTGASAGENMSLPVLGDYFRGGRLRHDAERADARELAGRFQLRPCEPELPIGAFSGGNQQKVVLAKWMRGDPLVLLLHEPTQGVDAGARKEILEIVNAAAEDGAGVAIFSSDYEQLANTCQRILVLADGGIVADLNGESVTEHEILLTCHAVTA